VSGTWGMQHASATPDAVTAFAVTTYGQWRRLAVEYLTSQGQRFHSSRNRRQSYFMRAEAALDLLEFVSSFNIIVPGYPQEDLRTPSHGEGYLAVFREVFSRPGLYLLDEPEAALSFTASLQLVAASTPGADILEPSDAGIRRTTWDDLELVGHWRRYLNHPGSYLRHLLAE
jgi:predicted ATPase